MWSLTQMKIIQKKLLGIISRMMFWAKSFICTALYIACFLNDLFSKYYSSMTHFGHDHAVKIISIWLNLCMFALPLTFNSTITFIDMSPCSPEMTWTVHEFEVKRRKWWIWHFFERTSNHKLKSMQFYGKVKFTMNNEQLTLTFL